MPEPHTDARQTALHAAQEVGFPRGVCDPECPAGHELTESVERRLLWHLETFLAVSGTTDTLRAEGRAIALFLHRTCEHHWHHYDGETDIPAHSQCLWCNDVEWDQVPSSNGADHA